MPRAVRLLLLTLCLGLSVVHTNFAQTRVTTRYVCPMHAEVVASEPGRCPRCNMTLVASAPVRIRSKRRKSSRNKQKSSIAKQNQSPAQASPSAPRSWAMLSAAERLKEMERLVPISDYTCLMHPDIHQAQEGVCPRCGMPLVSVNPLVRGEYRLELASSPRRPKAGEKVRLRFVVFDPQTGATVKRFVVNHEKLFHLFVVSKDMNDYQHIHPQLEADGSFIVETVLPRRGLYKLHSDFFPVGGTPQIIHGELVTAGYVRAKNATMTPARLTPDATLTKTVDGMNVSLTLGNGDGSLVAGDFIPLKYRLTDEQTGAPVQDLEPYLGAWGHTLILNADQSDYLHSHPTEMLPAGAKNANARGGPEVAFGAMFPEAGDYRISTQFQRGGKVITVSFTVRVSPESRARTP